MAKVPDLFEDLKNCFSDNEEYSCMVEHLSLDQKSFYDASDGPLGENRMDKLVSLGASGTSRTSKFTFEDSMVVVAKASAGGKILKKRWLSLNQPITEEDLRAVAGELEEETITPRSAPRTFLSNVRYTYRQIVREQFVLNDTQHQNIIREPTGQNLRATSLTNQDQEVKFDMSAYLSQENDSKYPVTLRISKTRLFVSAQNEDEPVLLKEMPETPKVITGSETNLIFFWETHGSKNYFTSAVHPELFLATKPDHLVHMAKGLPSLTDFEIS